MACSLRPISSNHSHPCKKAVSELADIVNQYSTRWSDLDFYLPDCYYHMFHATDNHAPILKSIRFHSGSSAQTPIHSNFQLICPRLEAANLSFVRLKGTTIQWDNLTHLTLHSMSTIDSFLILRKTPRLVFCKVSGTFHSRSNIGPTVLTSLRSLQLMLLELHLAKHFLNNLIAPNLEDFNLTRYYDSSMEFITSFLRRSACSLRSFSMIISSIFLPYYEVLLSPLQSMPSLNTLSIISIRPRR